MTSAPGTDVTEGELSFPDAASLPDDEPLTRYDGGDTNLHLSRTLKYLPKIEFPNQSH